MSSLIYQALGKWDIHVVKICMGPLKVSQLLFVDVCFFSFVGEIYYGDESIVAYLENL
jgi:hypothetical protein